MRKIHRMNGSTASRLAKALAVFICLIMVATYSIGTLPVYGEETDVDGQAQSMQEEENDGIDQEQQARTPIGGGGNAEYDHHPGDRWLLCHLG